MALQLQMQQLLQTQQQIQQLQAALLAQGLPAHVVNSTGTPPAAVPAQSPPLCAPTAPDLLGHSPLLPPLMGMLSPGSTGPSGLGLGVGLGLGTAGLRLPPAATLAVPGLSTSPAIAASSVFSASPMGTSPIASAGLAPSGDLAYLHPSAHNPSPRSPLPSLEQLRARILNERHKQSLRRSASTSAAAHAVARAHALEKLIGAGAGISQRRALSPTDHLEAGRNRARRRTLLGHPEALDEPEEDSGDEDADRSLNLTPVAEEGVAPIVTEEGASESDNSEDEDLRGDALRSEKRASRIPLSKGPLLSPPRGRPLSVRPMRQDSAMSATSDASSFAPRPLLRRSRTIGGLTAMAELERRAEFLESLLTPEEKEQRDTALSPPPSPPPVLAVDTPRLAARAQLLRKLSARAPAAPPPPALPEQAARPPSSAHDQSEVLPPPIQIESEDHTEYLSRPLSLAQGRRTSLLRRHSSDDSELSEVPDSDPESREGIDEAYLARVDQMADTLERFTEESATRTRATDSFSSNASAAGAAAAAARELHANRQSESGQSFISETDTGRGHPPNDSTASLVQASHPLLVRSASHMHPTPVARSVPHSRTQSAASPLAPMAQLHRSPPTSPSPRAPPATLTQYTTPTRAPYLTAAPRGSGDKPRSGLAATRHAQQLVSSTPLLGVPASPSPSPGVTAVSPLTPPVRAHLVPDPDTHHSERHLAPDRSPSLLVRGPSQTGRFKRSLFGSLRRKKTPEPLSVPPAEHSTSASWQARHSPPAAFVPSSRRAPGPTTPITPDNLDLSNSLSPTIAGSLAAGEVSPQTAKRVQSYAIALSTISPPSLPGRSLSALGPPPRQLLRAVPVFQVVTASGIKDRFLFVFSDLVVIAKPVAAPEGGGMMLGMADLSWLFSVKTILELRSLQLSIPKNYASEPARPHPLMKSLVARFPRDADRAIDDVIARSGLPPTDETRAQLLSQTPDLDKDVLTAYLCDPRRAGVMQAYLACQRLVGVSVESALRALLIGLRFPARYADAERLLMAFVARWTEANAALIKPGFTRDIAGALVLYMFRLNDALHANDPQVIVPGYANPPHPGPCWNSETTADMFVAHVRLQDPGQVLSDQTLRRIYASIRSEPLAIALAADEPAPLPVYLTAPMPAKMIYGQPSASVTVTLPYPDREFALRLCGPDITFDPPVLTFAQSRSRSFTMTSRVLGPKQVVFVRAGRRSRYYAGTLTSDAPVGATPLPQSAAVTVERAFMQHTFVLASPEPTPGSTVTPTPTPTPTASARRYMFSVEDGEKRAFVTDALSLRIEALRRAVPSATAKYFESVGLEALRDALIDPTDTDVGSGLHRSNSAGVIVPAPAPAPGLGMKRSPIPGNGAGAGAAGDAGAAPGSGDTAGPGTPPSASLGRGGTLRQALGGITRRLDRAASSASTHTSRAPGPGRMDSVRDPERGGGSGAIGVSHAANAPAHTLATTQPALLPTGAPATLTGAEIVALCQHNSLLPLVCAGQLPSR